MRRLLAAAAFCALLPLEAGQALAAGVQVSLFHAISVKDDVVVGIPTEELASDGDASPLDVLGDRVAGAGYVTVWLYSLRRGDSGSPEWSPARRIILFAANLLRLEPLATGEKVVPPPPTPPPPGVR